MEIITLESEVWKKLNKQLQLITNKLTRQNQNQYYDLWLHTQDVCEYLHISPRTLARMRKKGEISYTANRGKYFYTFGDIKKLLDAGRISSNQEYLENLLQKGKSYVTKAQDLE